MALRKIFVTEPHGAQVVSVDDEHVYRDGRQAAPRNKLYIIDSGEGFEMALTGWEMHSLATQFLAHWGSEAPPPQLPTGGANG